MRVADKWRQHKDAAKRGVGDFCHRVAVGEDVTGAQPVAGRAREVGEHGQPGNRPIALFAVEVVRADVPFGRQHDHQLGAFCRVFVGDVVRNVHRPVGEAEGDEGVIRAVRAGAQPEEVDRAVAVFAAEGGGDRAEVFFDMRDDFLAVAGAGGADVRRQVVFRVELVAEVGVEPFVEGVVFGEDFVVSGVVDNQRLAFAAFFARRVVQRDEDVAALVDGQPQRVDVVRLGLRRFAGVRTRGAFRVTAETLLQFVLPFLLDGADVVVADPAFAFCGLRAVTVVNVPDFFEVRRETDAVQVFCDADVVRVGRRVERQGGVGFLPGEVFVQQGGEADGTAVGGERVRVVVKPLAEAVFEVDDVAVFRLGVDLRVEDLPAVAIGLGVVVQAVEAFVVRHEGYPEGIVEGVFRFAFGVNARQAHLRPVVAVVGFAEFAPFLLFAVDFVQRQPARFARRDAVVDLAVKGTIDVRQGFRQADAVFAFEVFQVGFGRAGIECAT